MCTDKRKPVRALALCITVWFAAPASAQAPAGPNLGLPASSEQIRSMDWDVFPGGKGLPPGRGTARQGRAVYESYCRSCHGNEGRGASADELAGARHGLTDDPPDKTIGSYWPYAETVFDFVRRSMPLDRPGILSDAQAYAVTAYLLYLNRLIGWQDVIDAKTLPAIVMPNRDGFIDVYSVGAD
ncbi:MAG: c-type cytochrome [Gammaproteobacteria bacterium]